MEFDREWEKQRDIYVNSGFKCVADLQSAHEKKGFECMEPILGLMRDTFTFYHQVTINPHIVLYTSYLLCTYLIFSSIHLILPL